MWVADSVITSIRTLAAASAEAADSLSFNTTFPILTKWLSVRSDRSVSRNWYSDLGRAIVFLSTRA